MALRLVPCGITEAREFVRQVHRHNAPPVSGLFAVAVEQDGTIVGVAVAGRPVARPLDDGWTYEVTRVGTDGARNGCSILYGAVRRAAKALGYLRGVTYTLVEEGGASLRAAGWREDGRTPGRSWDGPSRPREDKHTLGARIRWVVTEVGWDERGERPRVVAANDADETLSLFRDGPRPAPGLPAGRRGGRSLAGRPCRPDRARGRGVAR